jgi:DNA-binding HxlR family transcriptional regulator
MTTSGCRGETEHRVRLLASPKNATCTPHSYSDPESAQVRSTMISRCRNVRFPSSSSLPLQNRSNRRLSRASDVNRTGGAQPAGISRSSVALTSRGYGSSGRPVMILLDLMGRRMALRVLWELWRAQTPLTFRALQLAAETNPALLNTRLRELPATGLVLHDQGGYALTQDGRELATLLIPVTVWAERWAARWGDRKRSG